MHCANLSENNNIDQTSHAASDIELYRLAFVYVVEESHDVADEP